MHAKKRGRLLVLTGARQTGKSTLASMAFADYPLISLDAPAERSVYQRLSPAQWIERYPRAVLDEVQKLPELFHTLKACYDRDPGVRYVLLGSSQILMMKGLSETLAGRVALRELFAFTLPELALCDAAELPKESTLLGLLRSACSPDDLCRELLPERVLSAAHARASTAWQSYLRWGGMPALLDADFDDDDRHEWLRDYQATYLHRDLADLARLDRLEPFARAQKAAALRSAQTINYAELARLADVSPPTAKQFLRYLELSYQVILLPAWARNTGKRLSKQPKLHFLDPGIRRSLLSKRGEVDGAEFESAVVGEVVKQTRSVRLPVELFHLRTADGREVDLLIELEQGYVAVECKLTARVVASDFRHLRDLQALLDKPLLAGFVLSQDSEVDVMGERLYKAPVEVLLA